MSLTPVEEIKSRLDIVDLINEYVQLKPAGQNWKARCPFHNEKTPSFMVSRDRGTWHCFGCGRGGDQFSFVQEYEGMDFPEALRHLAKRAGVQLKDYDPKLSTQRTRVQDVLRWSARYYHEVLLKSREAESVRAYLKERGLTQDTIEAFQIGFALNQSDATYQALKKKGFKEEDIFQAGMSIKSDRGTGYYDRFRGRIMFPIHDTHGNVIAFSGRIHDPLIDPDRPTPPKYINSPQTVVYNKGLVLYGLDKAKAGIKHEGKAVVVEGQMDTIASHQAGVTNVVAPGGTALTLDQVNLLKRYTNNLVFAFDEDAAGTQAALRGVDQALQAAVDVTIVTLPFGKDPDELIKQNPPAWPDAIAKAQPILDYFFDRSLKNRDVNKVQDKKLIARDLLPIIAKVAEQIEQTHYLQRLGKILNVTEDVLRNKLPKAASSTAVRGTSQPKSVSSIPTPADRPRLLSERLLALLVHQPKFLDNVSGRLEPDVIVGDDLRALYKTLIIWYTQDHISTRGEVTQRVATVDPDLQERFTLLFLYADKEFTSVSAAELEQDLLTMVASMQRYWLSSQLTQLERDIRQFEAAGPSARNQLAECLERFRSVTTQLKDLSS